jgi:hypothetical protein
LHNKNIIKNLLIKFFVLLFFTELIKCETPFINNFFLKKNERYYSIISMKNRHEFSGLVQFEPFYEDSILKNATFGLNVNQSIYESMSPMLIVSSNSHFQNDFFKIIIEINAVREEFGFDLLSTNFSRNGISFDYNVACLQYYNEKSNTLFSVGRNPIWWGQTFSSTLVINPFSGPYDNIYFSHKLNNNTKIESFTAQLNSKRFGDSIYNRFLSGHKVSYLSRKEKVFINIGEIFLYTGINRSVDIRYLNPIIPYFIVDVNKDNIGNDNSNSILFLDMRYNFLNDQSIYCEFLLDDYQLDDTGVSNALGLKIGYDYKSMLMGKNFFFNLEKNILNDDTYSHSGVHSYFLHNERPIGYKYGQACSSTSIIINYHLNNYFQFKYSFLQLNRMQPSTISEWSFLDLNNQNYNMNQTQQFYDFSILHQNYNFLIEIGISNFPIIDYNISGILSIEERYMYMRLNYYYDFKTKI